ncbi:MAG TPA: DUF6545 domain-containing protein [Thermomicrobiales bacterium]|nr:DUF6545 domain-containing protein [Thermomicrobiales bacterium]
MHLQPFAVLLGLLGVLLITEAPRTIRHWHDRALRTKWLSHLAFTVAVAVMSPPLVARIDAIARVSGAATQLALLLFLASVLLFRPFLRYLLGADRPLPLPLRDGPAALVAALSVIITVIINLTSRQPGTSVSLLDGIPPVRPEYLLLISGYVVAVCLSLAWLACRSIVGSHDGSIRASFALQTLGWLCGANVSLVVVAGAAATALARGPLLAYRPMLAASWIGMLAALLAASWLPHVGDWCHQIRAYRELWPLWRRLHLAGGYIPLYPELDRRYHVGALRAPRKYVAWMCVNLRDNALIVADNLAPEAPSRIEDAIRRAGLAGRDAEILRDAACLHLALAAEREPSRRPGAGWALGGIGAADTRAEADYLCRVARAFRSPLARRIAAEAGGHQGGPALRGQAAGAARRGTARP